MMFRSRAGAVLAAALLPLSLAAGVTSAQATGHSPATDGDVTASWGSYVVGVSKTVTESVTVHVEGATSSTGITVKAGLDILTPGCGLDSTGLLTMDYVSGDTWSDALDLPPSVLNNACAGQQGFTVVVTINGIEQPQFTGNLSFRRAARFVSLNASPEPVKKGSTVTTVATIQRASWDDLAYHAYPGQPSELQFRTTAGSYANVKAVTAKTGGKLSGSGKQSVAGCWRYKFAGTSITGPVTATGDCVAIKH